MERASIYRRLMPYILALYIAAISAAFLYFNVRLTVEWVAVILFGAALLSGRALLFVRDWGVFIVALLAWQLASPLAVRFGFPWHLQEFIEADKMMFRGQVPSAWLQAHLYRPGVLGPLDIFAATLYLLHFLAPLLAGFLLWTSNRALFQQFTITFIVVAVAGFATYVIYPAVPPWMAAKPLIHFHDAYRVAPHGHVYLPGVENLFNVIMGRWYNPNQGTIFFGFLHLHYDPVAAMPSEHAAFPFLIFLFLRRQFGRMGYLVLLYIVALVISIMYLGQHYMIDALVGFAYAIAGYVLVMCAAPAVLGRVRDLYGGKQGRVVGRPGLVEVEDS